MSPWDMNNKDDFLCLKFLTAQEDRLREYFVEKKTADLRLINLKI